MNLKEYFENASGHGVLSTADSTGKVDAAIYARPHFMKDGTLAFIMANKVTYANLQSNPHAVYLFVESGSGYTGKRLYLSKANEVQDNQLIQEICRRCNYSMYGNDLSRYIVFFNIENVLPLIGTGS